MQQPWLDKCKQLPVGTTARFRCCGSTKAAVLFNNSDSWSMYCFRCHTSLKEFKQYQSLTEGLQQHKVTEVPTDLKKLSECSEYVQEAVYKFLLTKGIYPSMVPDAMFSAELKRVLFKVSAAVYMARALNQYQQPKWLQLGGRCGFAVVGKVQDPVRIVLTEDLLSAIKIDYVQREFGEGNVLAVSLLGTKLDTKLRAVIAQSGVPVLCMLDGDAAGYTGTRQIMKDLKVYTQVKTYAEQGLDPKDLSCQKLLEVLYNV
ncbi:DNA primase [Providencia phage vB_PstP_PS3]|uniref:DNA primase n=1 Tax=Providencia phage vB_PstP_PS3 TaxID=2848038 RepID=A0A411AWE0_9CAUD|nr:DNA primase [Providencia phage vB_PstP_PS3]QAX92399.1 DNA primase [Providencia phage vB_PstP_PS3]